MELKESTKDFVKLIIIDEEIEISIKYPKHSHLKKRFEVLDKFKDLIQKI